MTILTTSQRTVSSRQYRAELLDVTVVVPPSVFPVTLAETKEFLRVDGTDQDATINALIAAATSWAEGVTRRAFVRRTLSVRYAETPPQGRDMVLAFPPVAIDTITSINYVDADGASQSLVVADFTLEPLYGRLRLNQDASITSWPVVYSINYQYDAGYSPDPADATLIPEQIRQGILKAVASMFETRIDQPVGAQVSKPQDFAAKQLLSDFRAFGF